MCDYQERVTTRQTVRQIDTRTDRCRTKWVLCAAMLCRDTKRWGLPVDFLDPSTNPSRNPRYFFFKTPQVNFTCITWCCIVRTGLKKPVNTSIRFFTCLTDNRFLTTIFKTRAPRGTDRSPENNEDFCYKLDSKVKNLTTEWNEKQQHFITHASWSLLWIQFVAVAFRSEEEVFFKKGTPVIYFASPWIRLCADIAKYLYACAGSWALHPYKFRKHPFINMEISQNKCR